MTDENGKTVSLPECQNPPTTARPATPASKNAAQQFPYPGETPDSSAPGGAAGGAGRMMRGSRQRSGIHIRGMRLRRRRLRGVLRVRLRGAVLVQDRVLGRGR
jgi:hypothetical protein